MPIISQGLFVTVIVLGSIVTAITLAAGVISFFRLYQSRTVATDEQLPLHIKRNLSLGT